MQKKDLIEVNESPRSSELTELFSLISTVNVLTESET